MQKIFCIQTLKYQYKFKKFLNSFQNKIDLKKYRFAGKRWLTFDL